jgi:hypothetical protein
MPWKNRFGFGATVSTGSIGTGGGVIWAGFGGTADDAASVVVAGAGSRTGAASPVGAGPGSGTLHAPSRPTSARARSGLIEVSFLWLNRAAIRLPFRLWLRARAD